MGGDSNRWAGRGADGRGEGQMGGDSDRWAGTGAESMAEVH